MGPWVVCALKFGAVSLIRSDIQVLSSKGVELSAATCAVSRADSPTIRSVAAPGGSSVASRQAPWIARDPPFSSLPASGRNQEPPHAKENHADCSRNALCSWRKTFEGDGRRHGGHCR